MNRFSKTLLLLFLIFGVAFATLNIGVNTASASGCMGSYCWHPANPRPVAPTNFCPFLSGCFNPSRPNPMPLTPNYPMPSIPNYPMPTTPNFPCHPQLPVRPYNPVPLSNSVLWNR